MARCALDRDGSWQGRLYYTLRYLCFHGKLFSRSLNVSIEYKDIVAIEKRSAAAVIPTQIKVATLNSIYLFGSLLKRDKVYGRITRLWKDRLQPSVQPGVDLQQSPSDSSPVAPAELEPERLSSSPLREGGDLRFDMLNEAEALVNMDLDPKMRYSYTDADPHPGGFRRKLVVGSDDRGYESEGSSSSPPPPSGLRKRVVVNDILRSVGMRRGTGGSTRKGAQEGFKNEAPAQIPNTAVSFYMESPFVVPNRRETGAVVLRVCKTLQTCCSE